MQKQTIIWVLAAANVALASTLAWRGLKPNEAVAQTVRPEPGKYTLIPGASQIGTSIIYVLDSANRRIGGFASDAREAINVMPTLALDPIFDAAANNAGPKVNPENQRPQGPGASRVRTPAR